MEEQNKTAKREDVCPSHKGKLDLESVRARLDEASKTHTGPEYWRSLEELAGSPAFQEALHREFPKGASEWVDSVSRRGLL
ncbi:MAG: TAT-variant-translocated molybdopterin oxidoreductase, partial [Candidatus Sulfotelmatobacter sp.]